MQYPAAQRASTINFKFKIGYLERARSVLKIT